MRFREAFRGYRPGDVDSLLDRVAKQMDAGQPFLATIEAALPLPRSVRGYSMDDVDQFLTALGGRPSRGREYGNSAGQHFARSNTGGSSADDLSDVWLTTDDRHILQVKVRARGVFRLIGWGDPREWLIWPFTWVVHMLLYRHQWAVEVYERRVRVGGRIVMPEGRVVYSRIFSSYGEAREIRHRIAERIQQDGSSEGA